MHVQPYDGCEVDAEALAEHLIRTVAVEECSSQGVSVPIWTSALGRARRKAEGIPIGRTQVKASWWVPRQPRNPARGPP